MKFSTCFPSAKQHYGKALLKTIMVMKLIVFFIVLTCLKVSASVYGQNIIIAAKQEPIEKVFSQIEKQTSYQFWYKNNVLKDVPTISVTIESTNLQKVLDAVFANQLLSYEIVGKTIVVKKKTNEIIKSISNLIQSINITGKVVDENNQPIPGVNIKVKGSDKSTVSNGEGNFSIDVESESAVLIFSYIGYKPQEVSVRTNTILNIKLEQSTSQLEGVTVVNTGYQQLPKERSTGSFVQIDNELFNRRVSTNFLDRLDGVASGLIFNKGLSNNGTLPRNETVGISIRGRSTIDNNVSADPLIILDNFPFEGNLENINPNDIESITILKDAAAASIWGARSGNGVIVITSKKGKLGQELKVGFNSNVTVGQKPNAFYSNNYLTAPSYIEIETYLFNQGAYNPNLNNTTTFPLISPVVEILAQKRAGTLSESEANSKINALSLLDTRDDIEKYFLRNSLKQQHSLNFNGGSEKVTYNFSAGYDNNLLERLNNYSRVNLNANNTYRPFKDLEITTGIIFGAGNGKRSSSFSPSFPYLKLADDSGNALAIPYRYRSSYLESTRTLGFLDWNYRPLDEQNLVDYIDKSSNTIVKTSLKYNFSRSLNFSLQYQFEDQKETLRNYQSIDTYYTRDFINRYSQRSSTGVFTYPVPMGGIIQTTGNSLTSQNFRSQLNFDRVYKEKHAVNGLLGGEIRSIETEGSMNRLFGYDDELGTAVTNLNYATTYPVNPTGLGSQAIPPIDGDISGRTNRYISYYANGAYTYDSKYTFTISGRKDGANIFGVNTNDKITPLWSTGISWDLSKESFYKLSILPYLKFRATYGYNGNVYNSSAYLTASYSTTGLNGNQIATINSAPNANLRWEKIRNINVGVDFSTKKSIVSGSIEWFQKYSTDLIENALLAPSTGFISYKGNAASLTTNGLDLILTSNNLNGKLKWSTNLISSFQKDKVTDYDTKYTSLNLARFDNTTELLSNGVFPVIGNSLFGIYSFKSAGLDPLNGNPRGYLNGQVSSDYTAILNSTPVDDLVYHGSSRPSIFGAIRNSFSYKGVSLSFNITYKFDYYFRRKSINPNYTQLLNSNGHTDYNLRWQKSGDELTTIVPSLVYAVNANRSLFYQSSDILVERGDHIRFQDLSIDYDIARSLWKDSPFKTFQIYSYVNNLGILWKANKQGIDPDINDLFVTGYPATQTISIGIRAQF